MKARGVVHRSKQLITVLVLLMLPGLCAAAEIDMGTAYTPEELAKVREWEKTWVGKKIDNTNIDQVAELIPEQWLDVYKNPRKWGAPDGEVFWFEIVPYKKTKESKGYVEATQKYAGTFGLDEKGLMPNIREVAGRPFLNPQNGQEVAWNFEMNNHGDTAQYRRFSPNINPKSRTERLSDQEYWEFYFINRTEVEPKPALPAKQNKKGYRRGMFVHMYKPAEFLNTRMFTMRYTDQSKDDDSYLWYSQFRRIRRMSTAQRTDSIDGTDLIYDDEYLWDGQLTRNTYTLKGKKELLCSRHQDMTKIVRRPGQGMWNGVVLERCNTYVIEAINKDPNYLYGKRIFYVDPENYYILWEDVYDQLGRYWKCYMNQLDMKKTSIGDERPFIVGTVFQDFQRTHSGGSHQQYFYEPKISHKLSPTIFTIANLQKTY